MTTYLLIPGAASDSWYWHRVLPLLEAAGHTVVAVDLPVEDDTADFGVYADEAAAAVKGHPDVVVVAQSMGGFTAPLVAARRPVRMILLVAAMVPLPGESGGEWWEATGQGDAARAFALAEGRDPDAEFDPLATFFHDVPAEVAAEAQAHVRDQSSRPFASPFPLAAWPDVPTRFLLGRQDRLFPPELQRRVVQERLGITPDEIDGGHCLAWSRPQELAEWILAQGW